MQSIRNLFHTDKWWGKTIFIILIYALYWCVFYWSLFLIPNIFFEKYQIPGYITLFYAILLIPLLSFLIPHYIKKLFIINKIFIYIFHVFVVLLFIGLFIFMLAFYALHNFQMLG